MHDLAWRLLLAHQVDIAGFRAHPGIAAQHALPVRWSCSQQLLVWPSDSIKRQINRQWLIGTKLKDIQFVTARLLTMLVN